MRDKFTFLVGWQGIPDIENSFSEKCGLYWTGKKNYL